MKTQKKRSFGSIITSSILALTLAGGLVPSAGLAFAAEADDAGDQTPQEQNIDNETASDADAPAITNEVMALDASAEASEAAPAAEEAPEAQAPAPVSVPEAGSQSASSYTNGANAHITSAEVALVGVEETPQAVGSVEFDGIRYTINIDDPATVAATGLATVKPAGEVHIQSQVAISGTLYPVTAIQMIEGGGSAL